MVEVINRQRKHAVRPGRLRRVLEDVQARGGTCAGLMTLVLSGTSAVRTLNRKYRKKDRATDVLSFPMGEKAADGNLYLGDIIIAVPVAFRQARAKGHSLEREIISLAVHGFLHLLGYDHGREMESRERDLLEGRLG